MCIMPIKSKMVPGRPEFDAAFARYPANGFIKFMFRYFSRGTVNQDLQPSNIYTYILGSLFVLGFIATILNSKLLTTLGVTYSILLGLGFTASAVATTWNNLRLRKIRRMLGLTKTAFNDLIDKYYND